MFDELVGNRVRARCLAFWCPRGCCIVVTRVMYVSRVGEGCGVVSCVGGVISKLSGFCGYVHEACGRMFGVALCLSFV